MSLTAPRSKYEEAWQRWNYGGGGQRGEPRPQPEDFQRQPYEAPEAHPGHGGVSSPWMKPGGGGWPPLDPSQGPIATAPPGGLDWDAIMRGIREGARPHGDPNRMTTMPVPHEAPPGWGDRFARLGDIGRLGGSIFQRAMTPQAPPIQMPMQPASLSPSRKAMLLQQLFARGSNRGSLVGGTLGSLYGAGRNVGRAILPFF